MAAGRRAGSSELEAEAQMKLAYVLLQQGRSERALIAVDEALARLSGPSAARARAQRAIVLRGLGRLDEALQAYAEALPQLRRSGDLLGVQRMLVSRALVHADRHAFDAARTDLLEAHELGRRMGRELMVGLVETNLGTVESLRGDVPLALRHLERAERIMGEHGGQLGIVHHDRAELLMSVGLIAEARQAAERALEAYRTEGRRVRQPEARLVLAQSAWLSGDADGAVAHARAARRAFLRQGRVEWGELARLTVLRIQTAAGARPHVTGRELQSMVDHLDRAGWPLAAIDARLVAASLRRGGSAERWLDQAAGRATGAGTAVVRARGWYARARLAAERGDDPGTLTAARAGLRILGEFSASLGATDLRAHSAWHRTDLARLGLEVAFRSGRSRTVFEWAERGRATHLTIHPVRPPADRVVAELLSQLRGVVRDLRQDDTVRPAAFARRQADLERQIRDRTRQRAATDTVATPVASVSAVAAELGDRALIEYVALDGRLFAVTIVGTRPRLHELGEVAAIHEPLDRLAFALRRLARPGVSAALQSALRLFDEAAERLDRLLVDPLRDTAGRDLVVVPTGALHGLPWSALPSVRGRTVTVAPSATVWHSRSRSVADLSELEPAVAVVSGPGLAHGAAEAAEVARIHGVDPMVGAAATTGATMEAFSQVDVAHLATHGRLSAENPLFSELRLADGPLMVYDLESLDHLPRLVVLAACDSGRSVVHVGDELLGLAAAFLAGGTTSLIAPVTPISDADTVQLMVALHAALAGGRSPAAALAGVQREMYERGSADDRLPALAAAASFVCIGAG